VQKDKNPVINLVYLLKVYLYLWKNHNDAIISYSGQIGDRS
jgi:hypothetical protein